jgi:hypothetical protein
MPLVLILSLKNYIHMILLFRQKAQDKVSPITAPINYNEQMKNGI